MYFFPTAYPHELLYSILARYHEKSGNTKVVHTLSDIFGTKTNIANIELASSINRIIESLPINSQLTSDKIIDDNTLLSFYAAFKSLEMVNEIRDRMLEDGMGLYLKLGLVASGVDFHKYFKYCPICIEEDIAIYGEPYWHREQQVYGVFMCNNHHVLLNDSNVMVRGVNRGKFIAASKNNCIGPILKSEVSLRTKEHMTRYSEDAYFLSNNSILKNSTWIENKIRILLFDKGYAKMNNYMQYIRLRKDFIEFYGEEYLDVMNARVENSNWLKKIIRCKNISQDTSKYLLLIRFLGNTIEEFLYSEIDLSNVDVNDYLQQQWDNRLIELIKIDISQRQLCLLLGSVRLTVIKAMKRLNIEKSWESNGGSRYAGIPYEETREFEIMKIKMRKKWLQLHKSNPDVNSNQFRKSNDNVYAWLKRYDSIWINCHYRTRNRITNRVNWGKRDRELYSKVVKVIDDMNNGKPERITWGGVASKLGVAGWFYKCKDKLPTTKDYMELKVESLEMFHVRKIEWALRKLNDEGRTITKYNVLETAGVKVKYLDEIENEICILLEVNGIDKNMLFSANRENKNVDEINS